MVSSAVDHRRFCRLSTEVSGSSRTAYNARLLEVVHADSTITIAGPILGAPQAVLVLEKLIAHGSKTIVVFGWCGSLQSDLKIGDWVLPTSAHSEEGTSTHYPMDSAEYVPDADLVAGSRIIACRMGSPCVRDQFGPPMLLCEKQWTKFALMEKMVFLQWKWRCLLCFTWPHTEKCGWLVCLRFLMNFLLSSGDPASAAPVSKIPAARQLMLFSTSAPVCPPSCTHRLRRITYRSFDPCPSGHRNA